MGEENNVYDLTYELLASKSITEKNNLLLRTYKGYTVMKNILLKHNCSLMLQN